MTRTRLALLLTAATLTMPSLAGATPALASSSLRVWHTLSSSGQQPGAVVDRAPAYAAGPISTQATSHRRIAPGVGLTRFTMTDRRGSSRGYLLAIRTRVPGVSIDYTAQAHVTRTAPILKTLTSDHAIGGVNGDFYDIGVTGAPLGLGADRQRGVLHGRTSGWNSAFYLDSTGAPHLGNLPLVAQIKEHPEISVTNVNSAFVAPGGVGVYTPVWGATSDEVTQGQRDHVEAVLVRNHRVVRKQTTLPDGTAIDGSWLIGRGAGARKLAALRVGAAATVGWHLQGNPPVAISGSSFLVLNGRLRAVDDTTTAPRTAVGIEDDTGEVLLVVVDGRSSVSHGLTYVEMADLMVDLGCDSALNLDGGGSSTMVAQGTDRALHVVNTPSDGFQRSVADGIAVSYRQPH